MLPYLILSGPQFLHINRYFTGVFAKTHIINGCIARPLQYTVTTLSVSLFE